MRTGSGALLFCPFGMQNATHEGLLGSSAADAGMISAIQKRQ
jgi:hypothetical protein